MFDFASIYKYCVFTMICALWAIKMPVALSPEHPIEWYGNCVSFDSWRIGLAPLALNLKGLTLEKMIWRQE